MFFSKLYLNMMVLFLPVLDWSRLESLGRSADPSDAFFERKSNRDKVTWLGSVGRLSDV